MLGLQLGMLMIIAWQWMAPLPTPVDAGQPLAAVQQRLDAMALAQQRDLALNAKLEVLDSVVSRLDGSPPRVVTQLAERTGEVAVLQDDLRAHRALSSRMQDEVREVRATLSKTQESEASLRRQLDELRAKLAGLDARMQIHGSAGELTGLDSWAQWNWSWLAVGVVVGLICGVGLVVGLRPPRGVAESDADPDASPVARDRPDDRR
jgi:hypothetical protein